MTRDDIIRMAREAGIRIASPTDTIDPRNVYLHELERFFHAAYAAGAKAEREVCAKFLDSCADLKGLAGEPRMQAFCGTLLMGCADAIRARSGT